MDGTHLGRHEAGKTSAFTCHETQRQYAAYNRKINCAFQASVTSPSRGGEATTGAWGNMDEAGKGSFMRHFVACCNKDFTSNSRMPLISSLDYNDTGNSNLSTAFSFAGINSFPRAVINHVEAIVKLNKTIPCSVKSFSRGNNAVVSPTEK